MDRWYSKFGPFTWYKHERLEWACFSLSFRSVLIVDVFWLPKRAMFVNVGGKVNRRSIYGEPVNIEPWRGWRFGQS